MALAEALSAWDLPTTSAEGARRYEEIAQATAIARSFVFPRDITASSQPSFDSSQVKAAFAVLKSAGALPQLHRDFIDAVEARFHFVTDDLAPYWDAIENAAASEADASDYMTQMFARSAAWQRKWARPLGVFEDVVRQFNTQFHQLLFASFPAVFRDYLLQFLAGSLAEVPLPDPDDPRPMVPMPPVSSPSPYLQSLGVVSRYATTLMRVACDEIEKIAAEEAEAGWTDRRLASARMRVSSSLSNWISAIYQGNESLLRSIYSRFDYHLCKSFFDIRTNELFDIIVDYPDSITALDDLKECMYKIDQRNQVVEALRAANVKRLLHPGAETKDVIAQYINTIRCLRILDPLGVLLHKVAEPIRRHLRDRPDTIKCIVHSLVEGEELQDDNDPTSGAPFAATNDNSVEDFSDPKWEPEPNDAAPEFRTGKGSDIVGTLVSIYETRDAIVKELQSYVATRLGEIKDYDAVKEVRTIEVLKIRFGEDALLVCDVMLKDMSDSKRINDHIHGDINTVVQPLIISRIYWPAVPPSMLKLSPKLEQAQAKYEAAFHHFKPDKRLRWLQEQGEVTISLELEDRIVEVDVTPLEASVAELFEEAPRWTEKGLTERLGVTLAAVRGALEIWRGHGVLKSDDDGVWHLLETLEDGGEEVPAPVPAAPQPFQQSETQLPDRSQEYWISIKSLLSAFGPQNVNSIHRMLSKERSYDMTTVELGALLAAAKRGGLVLERRDGTWFMPP